MTPYLSEFIGTAILILLGDGVVANVVLGKTKGHGAGWIVVTAGWGLAVALAVFAVGRIGGAHINPAVTVALASIGEFPWLQVPGYLAAQFLGAMAGAVLVWLTYLSHWRDTSDAGAKLAVFATGPAIRAPGANLLCEIIGTAMLVFGVLAIGANAAELEKVTLSSGQAGAFAQAFSTGFAPLLIGLLVFSIGLSLGGPTGYAINPARDLGPRLAHAFLPIPGKGSSDWGYSWIPVLGPIVGGILGAGLFRALGM